LPQDRPTCGPAAPWHETAAARYEPTRSFHRNAVPCHRPAGSFDGSAVPCRSDLDRLYNLNFDMLEHEAKTEKDLKDAHGGVP
jgi:hypothetical protein